MERLAPVLPDAPTPPIVPLAKPVHLTAVLPDPAVSAPLFVAAAERTCLAEAVYYEARGESLDGQRAVAEVVIRRSQDARYPKTICGVVYQDSGRRNRCQFSFACDGKSGGRRDHLAWQRAEEVADYELTGAGRGQDVTFGATHFHTLHVRPSWSRRYLRTVQIGQHVFYRQPGGHYEPKVATASPAF
jgi:spore germination cell wall hydrolase CwlJ-like protein